MSPIHIIALIARLFAIALFLIAIRDLAAALLVADDPVTTKSLFPLYSAAIASLIAAAMLWFFPLTVAKKIYPVKLKETSHESLTSDDFYSLGFIILGSFLLFYVLSDAIYWLVLVTLGNREASGYFVLNLENKAAMITTAFEFLIAMYLILGSSGIVNLIKKVRR